MELCLNNLLIAISFCSITSCSGQNNHRVNKQKTGESFSNDTSMLIATIRNEFKRINSDTEGLKSVTKSLEDVSSEGGNLRLFYDKNNLRKAVMIAYGETGKSISEYYFKDGKLIFIYTKDESYDKPIFDKEQPNICKEEENRFYFSENKLIRWLDKSNKIVTPSEYPNEEKKLIQEVKSLLE